MSIYEIFYIATNIIYIFTVYKLFNLFFDKKSCNARMRNVILTFYFFAMSIIIFVTRVPIIMTIISVMFFFLLSLCYKSSFQKKLFSISFSYTIMIVIEILSGVVFGFFDISGLKNSTFNSISILIFIRVITLVIVYLLSKYIKSVRNNYEIPKIYYLAFFIVLFGTLYFFIAQLNNENITINSVAISSVILIIVNVTMVVMDEKIYNASILKNERNLLKQHNEALQNQMDIITQSNEHIRLLRHDYKDHLIMLSKLYKQGCKNDVQAYIDTIMSNIDNASFSNSNNFVIDSVLNFKLRNIKNQNIKLTLSLNVPISINIIPHDLTVILGNLIDNAILACGKSNEKTLTIKIECKMDNLIILIDNSYNGNIIKDKGGFRTTKLYKDNHGLGIKSVEKIVEKYEGEIRFDYTSSMFSVSVIIPY